MIQKKNFMTLMICSLLLPVQGEEVMLMRENQEMMILPLIPAMIG